MNEGNGEMYKQIPVHAVYVGKADYSERPFQSLVEWKFNGDTDIPQNAPFITVQVKNDSGEEVEYRFQNMNPDIHGRSVQDTVVTHKAIWGKLFSHGRIFWGARDIKGGFMKLSNSFSLKIREDSSSPYGFRVNGYKDDVGIDRINQASEYFNDQGLPTEVPVRTFILLDVVADRTPVPVKEWKKHTIEFYTHLLGSAEKDNLYSRKNEIKSKLWYMQGGKKYPGSQQAGKPPLRFYLIDRDLQVATRVSDLTSKRTEEEFVEELRPCLHWVNTVTSYAKEGIIPGTDAPMPFDVENPEDRKRYYTEWLPEMMGTYTARMHSKGIAHHYPHRQNWSLAGTLYDLDSVAGKPFGDDEPSDNDYIGDLKMCHDVFNDYMFGSKSPFHDHPELAMKLFNNSDVMELYEVAKQQFIKGYKAEYLKQDPVPESLGKITRFLQESNFLPKAKESRRVDRHFELQNW